MIKRSLTNELMRKLKEEFQDLWKLVIYDETLCPVFRNKGVDVYYRGYKLFSISTKGILRNKVEFNDFICNYPPQAFYKLFGKEFNLEKNPTLEEFPYFLPFYKQKVDYWFGAGKKQPYEREFEQCILRENNSEKFGRYSDYFILDMEYRYLEGGPEPDLVAVKMPRGKRNKKAYHFALIEVKYMDESFNGKAGILSHICDYIKLLENKSLLASVKKDMEKVFRQRKELGLLAGYVSDNTVITLSDEKPELILAFIGLNTNNGKKKTGTSLRKIMEKALEDFGEERLSEVLIAGTSELGFGLYEDRMTKLVDYVKGLY